MDRLLRIGLVPLKEMLTPVSSLALLLPQTQPVYINKRQPECTPRWQPPPCQEERSRSRPSSQIFQPTDWKKMYFVCSRHPVYWDFVMKAKLPKLTFLKSLWGSKTLDPSTSVSKHWVWPRLLVITSLENFFAHLGLFASFLTINSGKQTDPNLSLSEANPSLVSPPPPLQLAFQAVGEILRMSQQEF